RAHSFTRNRTRRSDYPPFISAHDRSRTSFAVAFVCVSGNGKGVFLFVAQVRLLVKPRFSAGSLLVCHCCLLYHLPYTCHRPGLLPFHAPRTRDTRPPPVP